jgi:hypothetical protein
VPTAKCRVPRLRRLPLAVARKELASGYCRLGRVKRPKRGRDLVVVAQSRKPGKKLRVGSKVGVRLGRG